MAYKSKEDKKAYQKIYRETHKEQLKKYYEEHKKEILIATKIYQNKNSKKIKSYQKLYNESPEGIYRQTYSHAKHRNIDFNLTREEFVIWYKKQIRECVYCGRPEEDVIKDRNGFFKRLSIDRKDSSLGYQIDNIVLCCFRCNDVKSNEFTFDEMVRIGEIMKERKC